jgi:SAM-dependent methyltransferase
MVAPTIQDAIRDFWDTHPCGNDLVDNLKTDYEAFFNRYDAFRYRRERHIPRRLDALPLRGKRVLEIGLGQGADSEQIIRRGAIWSGLDVSAESISRVRTRLRLRGLPHERLECGSALALPFDDAAFDIVFAHGVLHHIPDIKAAQSEIARVLVPNGELIAMLYARRSLNYLVSILLLRRLALAICHLTGITPSRLVQLHIQNARQLGLMNYLKPATFIHRNTDGPLNPYSKVYDIPTVRRDFPDFVVTRSYQEFMHAPPLPVSRLNLLAPVLGWHLWVHLAPRKGQSER